MAGSDNFVGYFMSLMANFGLTEETFAGAIIMDNVLNWDDADNSQELPFGFEQV